jgi:hypothetical protein
MRGGARRIDRPHELHQTIDRDHPVGLQGEDRKDQSLLARSQIEPPRTRVRQHRPQQADVQPLARHRYRSGPSTP